MTRLLHLLVAIALASGCAVDVTRLDSPALDGARAGAGLHQISRDEWESATAGCEDAPLGDLHLVGCEGEPSLGALVDTKGDVFCVDAMSALLDELEATAPDPLAADPSPQPSRPIPMGFATPVVPAMGTAAAPGVQPDPTPTPVVQADPTPTPVTNPDLILELVPRVERGPDEEDPTPTPTMEE